MINGISIENFRCFHKTDIQGFGLVNLIGGKNNVGKTSLLEGLLVGLSNNLKSLNKIRTGFDSNIGDDEYLFFNQEISKNLRIEIEENEWINILSLMTINENIETYRIEKQKVELYLKQKSNLNNRVSLIVDKEKQYPFQLNLSQEFDKADRIGESDEILKALKVVEPKIDVIKTYSDRPNIIFLKEVGQKQLKPISYFGDAIQKVMRYVITIANFHNQNGENTEGGKYLLIDEIENGLHYTVQEDFWEMVFKLAIAYDIQIFAATHSLEMIKAFAKISMKYEDKAAYFEMFRHVKTDEIAANRILPDALNYKLEHNRPLRGE
jgi:AAA15 family ATPase/GTPase